MYISLRVLFIRKRAGKVKHQLIFAEKHLQEKEIQTGGIHRD